MTQYIQNVASNVCGDLPPTIPVNIDCSLCAIGFPQAGGMIGVTFYGPICPPSATPSPSFWLGFEEKTAQFKCINPGQDNEPNPNVWVAESLFSGVSGGSCANQYKLRAVLTALNTTQISVSVTIYVLVPGTGGNVWAVYSTWSETLTETPSLDTTPYRGRAFSSPTYKAITVNQNGGKGDPVSFARINVGLISMRVGCGSTGNAVPDTCGFWDGSQWLTCLRGFVKSTNNTLVRDFTQFGFNTATCGVTDSCGCDTITLTTTTPPTGTCTFNSPAFAATYGLLGLPGGIEAVGAVQQVQHAPGVQGIDIIVKQIGNGVIYICTNDNGAGWVISAANVAKAQSPVILTATRATFQVWLYALNFPNDQILPVDCYTPPAEGTAPLFVDEPEIEAVAEPGPPVDQPQPSPVIQRVTIPCVHLGEAIQGSNRAGCGSCSKHKCAIHGECRKIDYSREVRQCLTCEDYIAK